MTPSQGCVLQQPDRPTLSIPGSMGAVHTISYEDGVYDEHLPRAKWELDETQGAPGQGLSPPRLDCFRRLLQQTFLEGDDATEDLTMEDEHGTRVPHADSKTPVLGAEDAPAGDDAAVGGQQRKRNQSKALSSKSGGSSCGGVGRAQVKRWHMATMAPIATETSHMYWQRCLIPHN